VNCRPGDTPDPQPLRPVLGLLLVPPVLDRSTHVRFFSPLSATLNTALSRFPYIMMEPSSPGRVFFGPFGNRFTADTSFCVAPKRRLTNVFQISLLSIELIEVTFFLRSFELEPGSQLWSFSSLFLFIKLQCQLVPMASRL